MLYCCVLKVVLIEFVFVLFRICIKQHWESIWVSYAGLRSTAFHCAIYGSMLVLYRAEQGNESRTRPQLQLRRRGFLLTLHLDFLFVVRTSRCVHAGVHGMKCHGVVHKCFTDRADTAKCGKVQCAWREGGLARCVADALLRSHRVAPLRSKHKLNKRWRLHYPWDTHTHAVPHKAERRDATLTGSHVLLLFVCLIISPRRSCSCSPWLPHVTLQSCTFVSLQGVSGLGRVLQCFHCQSHPWVSFRRMRVDWEFLSVFIIFRHWLYPAAQLNSNRCPSRALQLRSLGSRTFFQTLAALLLYPMTQQVEHLIASNTCFDLKQVITLKTTAGELVVKPSAWLPGSCCSFEAEREKKTKVRVVISGQSRFMLTESRRAKKEDVFFALTQQINHSVCRF